MKAVEQHHMIYRYKLFGWSIAERLIGELYVTKPIFLRDFE